MCAIRIREPLVPERRCLFANFLSAHDCRVHPCTTRASLEQLNSLRDKAAVPIYLDRQSVAVFPCRKYIHWMCSRVMTCGDASSTRASARGELAERVARRLPWDCREARAFLKMQVATSKEFRMASRPVLPSNQCGCTDVATLLRGMICRSDSFTSTNLTIGRGFACRRLGFVISTGGTAFNW